MFYLTTYSSHFIYCYMASDIGLVTIQIGRERKPAAATAWAILNKQRDIVYAPSNIKDSTHHGLYYISRGALAGTKNSSMGPP